MMVGKEPGIYFFLLVLFPAWRIAAAMACFWVCLPEAIISLMLRPITALLEPFSSGDIRLPLRALAGAAGVGRHRPVGRGRAVHVVLVGRAAGRVGRVAAADRAVAGAPGLRTEALGHWFLLFLGRCFYATRPNVGTPRRANWGSCRWTISCTSWSFWAWPAHRYAELTYCWPSGPARR